MNKSKDYRLITHQLHPACVCLHWLLIEMRLLTECEQPVQRISILQWIINIVRILITFEFVFSTIRFLSH